MAVGIVEPLPTLGRAIVSLDLGPDGDLRPSSSPLSKVKNVRGSGYLELSRVSYPHATGVDKGSLPSPYGHVGHSRWLRLSVSLAERKGRAQLAPKVQHIIHHTTHRVLSRLISSSPLAALTLPRPPALVVHMPVRGSPASLPALTPHTPHPSRPLLASLRQKSDRYLLLPSTWQSGVARCLVAHATHGTLRG